MSEPGPDNSPPGQTGWYWPEGEPDAADLPAHDHVMALTFLIDDRDVEYVENVKGLDGLPSGWAYDPQCRRAWNDDKSTAVTPVPSGRCPFEYEHDELEDDTEGFAARIMSDHEPQYVDYAADDLLALIRERVDQDGMVTIEVTRP